MAKKSAGEVLVLSSIKRKTHQLRRALDEIGREYKCEKCNITEWCGEPLTIEIHHIDGNNKNNVASNLQYLCPNCHSLTPNFYQTKMQSFCECGRPKTRKAKACRKCGSSGKGTPRVSRRVVDRPNKRDLEKLVWEKPTIHIASDYGVSDKAVSKWCKSYGINKPPRGYWAKNIDM